MGQGGPVGVSRGKVELDLSALRAAPNVAREAGRATAREIQNAFKIAQNEQRIALAQAQQTVVAIKAQQVQITATARAESSVRMSVGRAESVAQQQAAKLATATGIEEQKRLTASHRAEIRAREQESRRAQSGGFGGFARGVAGAALGSVGGPVGAFSGALASGPGGIAAGIGLAVVETGRAAIAGERLATSYQRQTVAALGLAGSQSKLNELLEAYDRATGGAVGKAQALADVTRLQAIGFASNAQELERFVTVARGISLATGQNQEYVISQLQLAIANRSTLRLDQLGLGVGEVQKRIDELRASNRGLTEDQVYQQAVLGLAQEKFGALTASAIAQAVGIERLATAWEDLRLEMGKQAQGSVNPIAGGIADFFNRLARGAQRKAEIEADQTRRNQQWRDDLGITDLMARSLGIDPTTFKAQRLIGVQQPELLPSAANSMTRIPRPSPRFSDDQQGLINQRYASLGDIDRGETRQINDVTRQGGEQRAGIIRGYEKSIAREAEDFGEQRAASIRKHEEAIVDIAEDSARQRLRWEQDLARNIADMQADSADRAADARSDTAKRIAELDEKFKEDQARREKELRDDMLSAAGRLDAVALLELRKDRSRQLADAKKAHEDQREDLQEQLQERLDEEAESLAKSIEQQREAHQRQLDDQAENDRLRLEDMKEAFAQQTREEDAQRAKRLERQAEDHNDQLAEFDRQQAARIQQIKDEAQEARAQTEAEFLKELDALGIRTKAYEAHQKNIERFAMASFDKMWKHMNDAFEGNGPQQGPRAKWPTLADPPSFATGGLVRRGGMAMVHAGEFVMPSMPAAMASGMNNTNNSRSLTVAQGAIVIHAAPGQSEEMIGEVVIRMLEAM